MTRLQRYRRIRRGRQVSQGIFLALFMALLLKTGIDTVTVKGASPTISAPVGLFLEIDPFIALLTVLSTHELYRNLLWAVPLIVATLFFGRFFCGWICPLGTLNHIVSSLRTGGPKGKSLAAANRYRPYQRWKYILLMVLLGAAALTSLQIGLVDPIALLTRSMGLTVVPAWDVLWSSLASWSGGEYGVVDPVFRVLAAGFQFLVVRARPVVFQSALLFGVLFAAVLVANRFVTRFWCRGLCPLGATLGVLSRFAIFGLQKDHALCTDCNRCALKCQGADDPQPGFTWRQSECHVCMNCVAECPEAGIDFRMFPGMREATQSVDLRRRTVVTALAGGIAAVPVMRAEPGAAKHGDPALVRPPGSVTETDFLARCVRCGECMNVCPNNALHPTFLQAGFEGMWSPMLVPRIGYCEPTCVLCGTVCPTGAIDEITEAEKNWVPGKSGRAPNPPLRIGTAFYDFGRCLPWAMATECIVCEEWCPTTPKAIFFEQAEAQRRTGDSVALKRPHVDPQICIGCGACEFACPVKGTPAITVTSVGETRNPQNSILLKSAPPAS